MPYFAGLDGNKDDAQKDLDEALPALDTAVSTSGSSELLK